MPAVLILLFFLLPTALASQTASAPGITVPAPPRYIKVDGPFAQKLVLDAKAAHPELKKIGLHAIPPGGSEGAIIANPIVSRSVSFPPRTISPSSPPVSRRYLPTRKKAASSISACLDRQSAASHRHDGHGDYL